MVRLFLDLDGVLADFELACHQLTGRRPDQFPDVSLMWELLKPPKCRNFYSSLPLMPGAMDLWQSVTHLNPTILTGLPRGSWAEPQKRKWVKQQFGAHVKVICCMAHEKSRFAKRGDVLLDDNVEAKLPWERAGGTFIHFTAAPLAILALRSTFERSKKDRPRVMSSNVSSGVPCRAFTAGQCSWGNRCRFSHNMSQTLVTEGQPTLTLTDSHISATETQSPLTLTGSLSITESQSTLTLTDSLSVTESQSTLTAANSHIASEPEGLFVSSQGEFSSHMENVDQSSTNRPLKTAKLEVIDLTEECVEVHWLPEAPVSPQAEQ